MNPIYFPFQKIMNGNHLRDVRTYVLTVVILYDTISKWRGHKKDKNGMLVVQIAMTHDFSLATYLISCESHIVVSLYKLSYLCYHQ